jgi:glycyl-tRNA synthetase
MVDCPPLGPDGVPVDIVGLDSSIIQNPKTWVASGHVGGFSDPMVDCKKSKSRYRADKVWVVQFTSNQVENTEVWIAVEADSVETALPEALEGLNKKQKKLLGPDPAALAYNQVDLPEGWPRLSPATQEDTLTEPREFNLMFETHVGAIRNEDAKAYLRPETAQGIFLNYKNIADTMRVKIPFGIAQIGKAFRNEVTPRNFIFRSREFEQMEMEWFCPPDESKKWYEFWKEQRMKWWLGLGISDENLRFRDHDEDELAHYSNACVDVEYRYPFTAPEYGELEGVAHRGCFDLTQHQEHARVRMEYQPPDGREKYIPNVIEPASGLTRAVLVLLCEAYREEWVPKSEDDGELRQAIPGEPLPAGYELRTVLGFKPSLAPIKVAVFPLLKNKPELVAAAREIYNRLRPRFSCYYDQTGAIGRRYRRQDEVGTPFCITIDFETLEQETVTVRHRDSMKQERMAIGDLESFIAAQVV